MEIFLLIKYFQNYTFLLHSATTLSSSSCITLSFALRNLIVASKEIKNKTIMVIKRLKTLNLRG